jgi:hypothetical protein
MIPAVEMIELITMIEMTTRKIMLFASVALRNACMSGESFIGSPLKKMFPRELRVQSL